MRGRRRVGVLAVGATAALVALVWWRGPAPGGGESPASPVSAPGAPPVALASAPPASPGSPPSAAARAGEPPTRVPTPAGSFTSLDRWVDPATISPEEREARRLHRLEESRRAREAYAQHPPYSRPLRESPDLLVPEQVAPTHRPLAPPGADGRRSVSVRQTQDRIFLRPGTVATVGLEATAEGRSVAVRVASAVLVRSTGSPPVDSAPVARVEFAPAGAGQVASFSAPAAALGDFTGDLLLRVEVEAGGERGALVYAFVFTGEPPAAFTARARDRLEHGSVVFAVGVEVRRPGRYRIQGRVDDAAGRPLALARYDGDLAAGALEVPLVLHGKIARDEGAAAPFVLRDVEGFRLLDGAYPDRETLAGWAGPFRSRSYRAEELSPAPWAGDEGPRATPQGR